MKIPEFSNSREAATVIEAYLRQVLNTKDIFHNLPLRLPEGREAFDSKKMHFSDMAGECPRKAILSALAPPIEEEDQPLGHFISGHMLEMLVVGCLELHHPNEFEHQFKLDNIPPETQAHLDLYWPSRNTIIEIKSTDIGMRELEDYPKEAHLRQVAAYGAYVEDKLGVQQNVVLIYIFKNNPSEVDVFAVPESYKSEMELKIQETVKLYHKKEVPPVPAHFDPNRFPCMWYSKGSKKHKCPMWEHCWGSYQEAPPTKLDEPQAAAYLDRLATVVNAIDSHRDMIKKLEVERDNLKSKLTPHFDESPSGILLPNVGQKGLKLVKKPGGVRYDFAKAVKRGMIPMEILHQIEVPRSSSEYVTTVRLKEQNESEPEF